MNIMVFDIETIPDCEAGASIFGLSNLSKQDVVNAMTTLRRQSTGGSDFLQHHLHQIVAISVVLRRADELRVWSLGDPHSTEKELLQRFFSGLEKYTPALVSWNGAGFDLPVIHYRSLKHGVAAPRYWETGDMDQSFRWNNYLNRYHTRHLDLMDLISGYQSRASASLSHIATMLGFPGKMGMSGANVWQQYQDENIEAIRNYCETDVLNTYLIYLRLELIRGNLSETMYEQECLRLHEYLQSSDYDHWHTFANHWKTSSV